MDRSSVKIVETSNLGVSTNKHRQIENERNKQPLIQK